MIMNTGLVVFFFFFFFLFQYYLKERKAKKFARLQKHPQRIILFIKKINLWFRFHCEPFSNNLLQKKIHFCRGTKTFSYPK